MTAFPSAAAPHQARCPFPAELNQDKKIPALSSRDRSSFIELVFARTCAGQKHHNPLAASQGCCETAPQRGAFWLEKPAQRFESQTS